jgi:hypothetical protein
VKLRQLTTTSRNSRAVRAQTLILGAALLSAGCGGGSSGGGGGTPPPIVQDSYVTAQFNLKDAGAGGGCTDSFRNLPVTVQNTTDSTTFSGNTDANCRHTTSKITIPSASGSKSVKLVIQSSSVYNYGGPAVTLSNATGGTTQNFSNDVYDFARLTDTLCGDDLLTWIKFMTGSDGTPKMHTGQPKTYLIKWRKQDEPIAYFLDSPGAQEQQTVDAINYIDSKAGLTIFKRVTDGNPATGIDTVFGAFPINQTIYDGFVANNDGDGLYLTHVKIQIMPADNGLGAEQEYVHALGFANQSNCPLHLMYISAIHPLADFEAAAIKVVDGLPDSIDTHKTDMQYLTK